MYDLNMIIAKFWWGSGGVKRGIHWLRWDSPCVSKLDGGLGFREFEAFNLALLAKQGWRLLQDEDTLCHRVMKAKYFPNGSFMDANMGSSPSFVWRSLIKGRKVLQAGCLWRVGDGHNISIYQHK